MKNIKKYILFIFIGALSSCSDDFIEKAPISEGNAENFYKTADDFEAAIIATYSNLQSPHQYGSSDTRFGGSFYALMEVRADDASDGSATAGAGKDVLDIDTFQDNPLSGVIEGAWISIFKSIFDANAIITRIESTDLDNQLKSQYTAEARFLRGLSYFNAVRLWGKVPVVLSEITPQQAKELSRDDVAKVYAAIESDFDFAAQNLPASFAGKEGRATSGAAKTLLGKVYLTQQKWSEATKVLNEVKGTYSLLPNVQDVFAIDNELNDEIIFSVRFASAPEVGHLGFGTPTYTSLKALYGAGDTRSALLDPVGSGDPDATYPSKQHDASSAEKGRDFPVLRYSDVLLMLAEAQNETAYQSTGDAFDNLNLVRTRAGIAALTSTDLANQEDFRAAVWKERRLELALELHRWFDLLRTNQAVDALSNEGITVKSHQLLYPIPQNEVNVYNNESQFPQNSGY